MYVSTISPTLLLSASRGQSILLYGEGSSTPGIKKGEGKKKIALIRPEYTNFLKQPTQEKSEKEIRPGVLQPATKHKHRHLRGNRLGIPPLTRKKREKGREKKKKKRNSMISTVVCVWKKKNDTRTVCTRNKPSRRASCRSTRVLSFFSFRVLVPIAEVRFELHIGKQHNQPPRGNEDEHLMPRKQKREEEKKRTVYTKLKSKYTHTHTQLLGEHFVGNKSLRNYSSSNVDR